MYNRKYLKRLYKMLILALDIIVFFWYIIKGLCIAVFIQLDNTIKLVELKERW